MHEVPSEERTSPNMATRRGSRLFSELPANVARSLGQTSDLSLAVDEAEREEHPSPSIGEPLEASHPSTASLSGAAQFSELELINDRASNYSSAIHSHDDAAAEAKWREGLIASFLAWETKEGPKDAAEIINKIKKAVHLCLSRDTMDEIYITVLQYLGSKATPSTASGRSQRKTIKGKSQKRAEKRYL
jgi:hypothetical protein